MTIKLRFLDILNHRQTHLAVHHSPDSSDILFPLIGSDYSQPPKEKDLAYSRKRLSYTLKKLWFFKKRLIFIRQNIRRNY